MNNTENVFLQSLDMKVSQLILEIRDTQKKADMNEIKDRKKKLSDTPLRGEICNSELYNAVIHLSEFLIQSQFKKPEAF